MTEFEKWLDSYAPTASETLDEVVSDAWHFRDAEIATLRKQVTLLRKSVEELIPENPCDTEHQYKVHHRALDALDATKQKEIPE